MSEAQAAYCDVGTAGAEGADQFASHQAGLVEAIRLTSRKNEELRFQAPAREGSEDKWREYRVNRKELATRFLDKWSRYRAHSRLGPI